MKDDTLYLGHIKDAIEAIEQYLGVVNYEQFVANMMMVDAVVRELEIIGEATSKLSKDFRQANPDIPGILLICAMSLSTIIQASIQ
jgi:uncharacterized protein with HEPN domain